MYVHSHMHYVLAYHLFHLSTEALAARLLYLGSYHLRAVPCCVSEYVTGAECLFYAGSMQ